MSGINFNPPGLDSLPAKKLATTTHVNKVIDAVNALHCPYVLGEARPADSGLDDYYIKLSTPWSSNTANVAVGHLCFDIQGAGAASQTNTIAIGLFTPPTYRPRCTPLTTGDILQFRAYGQPVPYSVFGGSTNTGNIWGVAIDAPEDVGEVYCLLSNPTGSAGDASNRAAFTYTATDPTYGTTFGTALVVQAPRLLMCTMVAATNGIGQWIPSGTNRVFSLTQAWETMEQTNCT